MSGIRTLVLFLALLPAAAPTTKKAPPPPPIPDALTLEFATEPVWRSARSVETSDGKLDTEVFGESSSIMLAAVLESPMSGGCRHVKEAFVDHIYPSPRESLDSAIASAQAAIVGPVTAREYGFYGGVPGQLLQIRAERRFTDRTPGDFYYFFVPVGDFRAGDVSICKRDERFADPPEVGEEAILLTDAPDRKEPSLLPVKDAGDVLAISRGGVVRLPPQYEGTMTRDRLLALLEKAKSR